MNNPTDGVRIFWSQVSIWRREKGRGFILAIENGGSMTYHTQDEIASMPLPVETRQELEQYIRTYNPDREAIVLDIRADGYGLVSLLGRKGLTPDISA